MKYRVYAEVTGTIFLGTIEASSKEEAEEKAYSLPHCATPVLCNQCAAEIELGDLSKTTVESLNRSFI